MIQKSTKRLDCIGSTFFRCVQEFFCEQRGHFPKQLYLEYGDIVIAGICCNNSLNKIGDFIIDEVLSLWIEREAPALCGKQVMIRSFFMHDFIDRKVIAALPEHQSGMWRLLFEGGQQLLLDEETPYLKSTLHPDDLKAFCSSNMQSILLNPVCAYNKWLQPNDICEEWHKAFLYLCAVSDTEWDVTNVLNVYDRFLYFLEENICVTTESLPIFSKEQYGQALLTHICDFRRFLSGEEEPVISKDLHQTMNSRYVYLPYLWPFVDVSGTPTGFSTSVFQEQIISAIHEKDSYKKGILWEDAAAYMLSNVEGWKITSRRIRAGSQEIDLSVVNRSLDPALWQLGAYVLVECKNWKTHVNIRQIRNIAHISTVKGNKTAILFAANGITAEAQDEILRLLAEGLSTICITASELLSLQTAEECKDLIMQKWQYLQDSMNLERMI